MLSDCELAELTRRQFDIVWANSVITHMPRLKLPRCSSRCAHSLFKGGRYFFTYSVADKSTRSNFQDYFYPTGTIERLVTEAGYRFAVAADYSSPVAYGRMAIAEPC